MADNGGDKNGDIRATLIQAMKPLLDSLVKAIDSEQSPDMVRLRSIFLRRFVFSGDVIPSRVPVPANITEIGGYLNFLHDMEHSEMALSTAASALGIAVPLSDKDRKELTDSVGGELEGSLRRSLHSARAWVSVCESGHVFWRGNMETSYNLARVDATAHDLHVHDGKACASVLSL